MCFTFIAAIRCQHAIELLVKLILQDKLSIKGEMYKMFFYRYICQPATPIANKSRLTAVLTLAPSAGSDSCRILNQNHKQNQSVDIK